jgi:predicted metal-dependent phosphotriesterase family hydrolase
VIDLELFMQEFNFPESPHRSVSRRTLLQQSAVALAGCVLSVRNAFSKEADSHPAVHTVLGPVAPDKLGVTLMHEHAPLVDWSELYEAPAAPVAPVREKMLAETARLLDRFHASLSPDDGPGAIVETTPIRVGRDPQLLVDLARRTKVHIIACTGFWCEALAPQHPWAARLSVNPDGVNQMAGLFVREITKGMEDPRGTWGERFTDVRAGIIKIGTSTHMRPSERVCHIAAALASRETGCPVTTHTTKGGGLEEAELLLKHGAAPGRIIIGHQGHQDDREHDEADEYHRQIARLGCYVQFDRVDHNDYGIEKQARQIARLVEAGFVDQLLVSHDHSPYYFPKFTAENKRPEDWKALEPDYTTVTTKLVEGLRTLSISKADIRRILVDNPRRVLAF